MKTHLFIIALASALLGCASTTAQTSVEDAAAWMRARRAAREQQPQPFTPTPAPYPVAEPSAVYTSVAPADVARIPAVFKVDRLPIGLLKWTAAQDRPGDAVVGYEIQRDSGSPINLLYIVPSTVTEFPFTAGMAGMINTVADEFWRVRAVFHSGARSAWVPSQNFPEPTTLRY